MPHRFVDQRGCPNDLGLLSALKGVLRGPLRGRPCALSSTAQVRSAISRRSVISSSD